MTLRSVGDIAKRMQALERSVSGEAMRKRMVSVGVAVKPLATDAARSDLGADAMFSGWPKIGVLEAKFSTTSDPGAIMMHRSRKSAGGWTVATSGRNQGNATGVIGPKVGARARKGRRWNGTTRGKGTWDKAAAAMGAKAPELLVRFNREAVFKAFTGG